MTVKKPPVAAAKEAEKQARIDKRKADAETWEDIKTVLIVMGVVVAAVAVVAGSIYYTNMGT